MSLLCYECRVNVRNQLKYSIVFVKEYLYSLQPAVVIERPI